MNDPIILEHYRYLAEIGNCTPEQIFERSPWFLITGPPIAETHPEVIPKPKTTEVVSEEPPSLNNALKNAWIDLGNVQLECMSSTRVMDTTKLVQNPSTLCIDLSITYPRFLAKKFSSKNIIRTGTLLRVQYPCKGSDLKVPTDPLGACFNRLRLDKVDRTKQLAVQPDGLSLENYVATQLFSGRSEDVVSALLLIMVPYSGRSVGSGHSEFVGESAFLSYSGNAFMRVMQDGRDIGKLTAHGSNALSVLLSLHLVDITFSLVDLPQSLDLGTSFSLDVGIRLSPLALRQKAFIPRLIGEAQSILRNAFFSLFNRVLQLKPFQESVLWNLNCDFVPPESNKNSPLKPKPRNSSLHSLGTPSVAIGGNMEDDGMTTDDGGITDDGATSGEDIDENDDELRRKNNEIFGTGVENVNRPPALSVPESVFASKLRKYQMTALEWMYNRESGVVVSESGCHPMWNAFRIAEMTLYMNHISGEISVDPPGPYTDCRGGILADEMGLGKTVEVLSLVGYKLEESRMAKKLNTQIGGTLIIMPLSLVAQWNTEIGKHFSERAGIRTINYTGDRDRSVANLISHDIVLTTYGTALSECSKGSSPLYLVDWDRIVLDEAHYIKSRSARTSKAIFGLRGKHKWCLTGTPIQNSLDDVFSLFHFLQVEPWGHWGWWNRLKLASDINLVSRIQKLTEPLLLRRTIQTIDSATGRPIISLPPKYVYSVWLEFRQTERDFYNAIYNRVATEFEELIASGPPAQKYTSMLQLLLRLRQACCHPILVYSGAANKNMGLLKGPSDSSESAIETTAKQFARSLAKHCGRGDIDTENFIKNQIRRFMPKAAEETYFQSKNEGDSAGAEPCPICLDTMESPVISHCGHVMCMECVQRMLKLSTRFVTLPTQLAGPVAAPKAKVKQAPCPVCRTMISSATITPLVKPGDSGTWTQLLKRLCITDTGEFAFSAKLEFLDRILSKIVKTGHRVVVFSQWVTFLDLIEELMHYRKIPYCRLDGSQTAEKRREQILKFTTSSKPDIMADLADTLGLKTENCDTKSPPAITRMTIDHWNAENGETEYESIHSGSMVLLASLKAGGVGLNLTAASYLFLMDSWWNPAVEEQAMQRVHRIGQNMPVHIFRLYVKVSEIVMIILAVQSSVEERILQLQDVKGERAR